MRKVVGILSMQRVINYGSFLQAYALKQLLLRNGADEVCFIDIKPGKPLPGYEMRNGFWSRMERVISLLVSGKMLTKLRDKEFYAKLRESIEKNFPMLGLDKPVPDKFDLVVIGSDEVFNCCQKSGWGYTLQLYGAIPNASKVISYAGSFGHTTYEQLVKYGIDKEIGDTMRRLSAISVRDRNSFDIVEKITGIKPEIHLDPVLIYGYQKEIAERKVDYPERYMVVYSYQERINDREEIQKITSFAKSKGLRLISVFCRYDWCDEAVIPETPFDVLAWFKGAEYVITDTFHGTIFSVITHRLFCTLVRDSNGEKIGSLLEMLGLNERMVKIGNILSLNERLVRAIDYSMVEEILELRRKDAGRFISSYLGNEAV